MNGISYRVPTAPTWVAPLSTSNGAVHLADDSTTYGVRCNQACCRILLINGSKHFAPSKIEPATWITCLQCADAILELKNKAEIIYMSFYQECFGLPLDFQLQSSTDPLFGHGIIDNESLLVMSDWLKEKEKYEHADLLVEAQSCSATMVCGNYRPPRFTRLNHLRPLKPARPK